MGLAERAAMRPKGVKVVCCWREERGSRGLADARKGRRDARTREEYIIVVWSCSSLSFFFLNSALFLELSFWMGVVSIG